MLFSCVDDKPGTFNFEPVLLTLTGCLRPHLDYKNRLSSFGC